MNKQDNFFSTKPTSAKIIATKITAFSCIALLGWYSLGLLGSHISPIYAHNVLNQSLKMKDISKAEIITLGSSHNHAIIPELFDNTVLNLWTPGQNFEGSIFITQYFKEILPQAKIFLLPVSISSIKQNTEIRTGTVANLMLLDQYNSLIYRATYNLTSHIDALTLSFNRYDAWESPIRKILNQPKVKPITSKNPFEKNYVKKHIENLVSKNELVEAENKLKILKLTSIINQMGACLVLYESPVSFNYVSKFKKSMPSLSNWKEKFKRITQSFKNDYCIYFIENIWPLKKSKNSALYKDQHHLNKQGSINFSPRLNKRIIEIINQEKKL